MKKVLISGSWRYQNPDLEAQVRQVVRDILAQDAGIISGGALGVDYWALDEALQLDPQATRIQIFLPSPFNFYKKYYKQRALEKIISTTQYKTLIAKLKQLKKANPAALIETKGVTNLNQKAYFERNSKEVYHADEMIAFQVNGSAGTQDTIDKAKRKGISVQVRQFEL
jgi:uncharacterized phage-like protein YoqJ